MSYIPDRGDIIWLNFDPSSGREIIKRRPAYVISRKAFNQHTGLAFVAPITSTICGIKLEVVLDKTLKTQGAILVHQIKSFDFVEREAVFIERVSGQIVEQVKTVLKCELRAEISFSSQIKQLKISAFSFMPLVNSTPLIFN